MGGLYLDSRQENSGPVSRLGSGVYLRVSDRSPALATNNCDCVGIVPCNRAIRVGNQLASDIVCASKPSNAWQRCESYLLLRLSTTGFSGICTVDQARR